MKQFYTIFLTLSLTLIVSGCTKKREVLGSEDNPIKFFFIPSVDVKLIEDASSELKKYLEENTPYKFKIAIPPSYIAVVEAFGTSRADVASISLFGYMLAHEKYGVEAHLITIRYGERTYRAQFLARSNSSIKTLKDLNGKKMAFVDPSSVSGYLLPLKHLKEHGIKPRETMFAMRHDNVVSMIYQGQVDAGATFYSPPEAGKIQDARRLVLSQYPDVESKIKIIELSSEIPNDPIVYRKDLPEEIKQSLSKALIQFAASPTGLKVLGQLSSITGLAPITDKDYDKARADIKLLGKDSSEVKK